jgi:hypothetical protein
MPSTRTRPSRLARTLTAGTAWIALLLMLAGSIGRLLTDRFAWSQFLWWAPGIALAGVAAVLLLTSALAARAGGRPITARRVRRITALLLLVAILQASVFDLGVLHRPRRVQAGSALRVLNWNVTWVTDRAAILRTILDADADVTVLVNPHMGVGWNELFGLIPYQYALVYRDGIVVISKYPIHRFGSAWLGIEGLPDPDLKQAEDYTQKPYRDPGRALWFDVDAGATLGRSFTIWTMDLPSDPRLSRWRIAGEARAGVERWLGPGMLRNEQGQYRTDPEPVRGFPAPDLLMGDLNIPRGSASLSRLAPGMHNAYADAGRGWAGTYPRRFPLVHIDQMLLGAGVRAAQYRVFDPGIGHHYAQVAEILAR